MPHRSSQKYPMNFFDYNNNPQITNEIGYHFLLKEIKTGVEHVNRHYHAGDGQVEQQTHTDVHNGGLNFRLEGVMMYFGRKQTSFRQSVPALWYKWSR